MLEIDMDEEEQHVPPNSKDRQLDVCNLKNMKYTASVTIFNTHLKQIFLSSTWVKLSEPGVYSRLWLPIILYLFTFGSRYERPVCERRTGLRRGAGPVYLLLHYKVLVNRPVCERAKCFLEVKKKWHTWDLYWVAVLEKQICQHHIITLNHIVLKRTVSNHTASQ